MKLNWQTWRHGSLLGQLDQLQIDLGATARADVPGHAILVVLRDAPDAVVVVRMHALGVDRAVLPVVLAPAVRGVLAVEVDVQMGVLDVVVVVRMHALVVVLGVLLDALVVGPDVQMGVLDVAAAARMDAQAAGAAAGLGVPENAWVVPEAATTRAYKAAKAAQI